MNTKRVSASECQNTRGFLEIVSEQSQQSFELEDFVTLGREPNCKVHLSDPFSSQKHARIERTKNGFVLKDLRSSNGTFLNGARIVEAILNDKDRIRIGQTQFIFSIEKIEKKDLLATVSKNSTWNEQLKRLSSMSSTEFSILITGPSGAGKEILARLIHRYSARNFGPFVSVNCSALSENLVESELFGHVKGAFTGADRERKGAFEAARGGTLFLDEIGDLPLHLQPKLLRALENKEVKPVGSDSTRKTDVRIVSATHQNLRQHVSQKKFREDLFFRLNVINLSPPPLSRRMEDFEDLLYTFCKEYRISFSFDAIQALKNHDWPGNIRELKNLVARASALFNGQQVKQNDVTALIDRSYTNSSALNISDEEGYASLKDLERTYILKTLLKNKGNQRKTADQLGIPKSTLHDRIKAYGVSPKELENLL